MPGFESRTPRLIDVVTIVVIAALVVFYRTDAPPVFWWDEARVAVNSFEMMTAANPLIVSFNGQADLWNTKPPLAIWLNALSMKAFGVNELALRLPAALAAIATVVAVYGFTLRVSQSRATGILAALILLGTGGYVEVHVARTADFDSLLVLFVTLTTFSLFLALETVEHERKWFYAAAAFLAAALFTKSVAALLMVPGYVLYLAWSGKLRAVASNSALWLSGAIVLASVLLFLGAREMAEPGYAQAAWMQDVARFGRPADGHVFGDWRTYLLDLLWPWQIQLLSSKEFPYVQSAFPWIWLVPFAALPFTAFPSGSQTSRASAYLLCCLVAFLVIVSVATTRLAWYVAPAYPLIAVLSALGITQLRTVLGWPRSIAVGFALAVACIALNVWKIEKGVSSPSLSAEQSTPSFLRSLDVPPSAKLRVVRDLTWTTTAVKGGKIVGTETYYGPLDFYVRVMRARGLDVRVIGPDYDPRSGEVVIGCGEAARAAFRHLRPLKVQGDCFALVD